MNESWDIENIKAETIKEHLREFHQVSFDSREALSIDEFVINHFPSLLKDDEDYRRRYITDEGKKRLSKARRILREAIKLCEEERIPIAIVFGVDRNSMPVRRICKPTQEDLDFLKWKRYFKILEGIFHKVLQQDNFYQDYSIDEETQDVLEALQEGEKERAEKKKKAEEKKKKAIPIAN